jgi:hypothetical protein
MSIEVVDAGDIPVANKPMRYKGKELMTIGDLCEEMDKITNREDAQEFLAAARSASPEHADHNIGYLMGYLSRPKWALLSEWMGIEHPVFGKRYDLTDDEIFQMGLERGRAMARGKK